MAILEGIEIESAEMDGLDALNQQSITVAECSQAGHNVMVASLLIGSVIGGVVGVAGGAMLGVWLARRADPKGHAR